MESFDILYWLAAFFALLAATSLGLLLWVAREPRYLPASDSGKDRRPWLPARM